MTEEETKRPRRRWWILLGVCALLGGLVGAAAIWLPRCVRARVDAEARRRGIDLGIKTIEIGLGRIRLIGVRFSLAGVKGMSGTLDVATIDLAGLTPRAIGGEGLTLRMTGTAFVSGMVEWTRAHPEATALPFATSVAHVRWREREAGEASPDDPSPLPEIDLAGGTLAVTARPAPATGTDTTSTGGRVSLGDKDLGRVDLFVTVAGPAKPPAAEPALAIGVGGPTLAASPIRIEIGEASPAGPRPLHATLVPTPASAIASVLGLALPATSAVIGGSVDTTLPDLAHASVIAGTIAGRIDGFVPPHPRELDGIVFGDHTDVDAGFRIMETRTAIDVIDLHVAAGALKLSGYAAARWPPRTVPAPGTPAPDRSAHVTADLSGAIPCTMLARSAAGARLGKTVGDFAGNLANRTITGSVAVRVQVEADTATLGAARIEPSAVVRCKLKGLLGG